MLRLLTTIGAILWIVVGITELVSLAPPPVNNSPVNNTKAYDNCAKDETEHPSLISFFLCKWATYIDRVRDDITAVSTLFIMIFTAILSSLNYSLAKTARISADVAARSLEITQRAYIRLEIKQLVGPTPGEYIRIKTEVTNDGNTPATIIASKVNTEIYGELPGVVAFTEIPDDRYSLSTRATHGVWSFNDELIPTKADIDDIMSGRKQIFFFFVVMYKDEFGHDHETGIGAVFNREIRSFEMIKGGKYNYAT